MKRLIALLWIVWSAFAGDADITGIAIEDNGWVADVWIQSLNTNGTFAYGLGLNNSLTGTESLKITLSSAGYDDTGATQAVPRTIYGTKTLRFVTPGEAYVDTTPEADGRVKCRIALSDFVFLPDVSLVATVAGSLYTENGTNSIAASGVAVTNNSTQIYQKCVANWAWPGWQLISGDTMTVRAVGFHASAEQGRPLRMVRFLAVGATSGVAVSNEVLVPTIDRAMPDLCPVVEYIASMDISGMTQNEQIRVDFTAFPWIGDSGSLIDTTLNAYSQPTPFPASITNVCNRSGTYGITRAIVDPAGADATGVAASEVYWATNTSPSAFATINGAAAAIYLTNNAFLGRGDSGAGEILLNAGNYPWTGASAACGATPKTWVTIKPSAAATKATVGITNYSGLKDIADRVRIQNCTIGGADATGTMTGIAALWWDGCTVIPTSSGLLHYNVTAHYVTHSDITSLPTTLDGFRGYSVAYSNPLFRGNTFVFVKQNSPRVWIGNARTSTTALKGVIFQNSITGGEPVIDNVIVAFNDFRNLTVEASNFPVMFGSTVALNNVAIVQNVWEKIGASAQGMLGIAPDGSTVHTTNWLFYYNTFVGQRMNGPYNDSGSAAAYRNGFIFRNNYGHDWNIKSDTYAPANANRIGNWPAVWGVGWSGNIDSSMTNSGGPGSFNHTASGGLIGVGSYETLTIQLPGWDGFVLPKDYAGGDNAGGGNYRFLSSAFAINPTNKLDARWMLPCDIEGVPRGAFDPPGAYASASPRKGAGFFSP